MPKYQYGWRRQKLDHRDLKLNSFPVDLKKSVDLRPEMPRVYNQGQTSSCVGNATAAAIHYARIKQSLATWTPSRLFLYYNARVLEGTADQDSGSEIRDAVKQAVNLGVCSEDIWPFDPLLVTGRPSNNSYDLATHARVTKYAAVDQSLEHILSCLHHGLPVVFGCSVYNAIESEDVAASGIVPMPGPDDAPIGGHAMLIVGWDADTQQFIVRNSWGEGWGQKGYCFFPRDYVLNPNIASDFWAILLEARN